MTLDDRAPKEPESAEDARARYVRLTLQDICAELVRLEAMLATENDYSTRCELLKQIRMTTARAVELLDKPYI